MDPKLDRANIYATYIIVEVLYSVLWYSHLDRYSLQEHEELHETLHYIFR